MKTTLSILAVVGAAAPALAGNPVIAAEDFDGNDLNLISSNVPTLDGGPGDFFGVGNRNNWPQGFPSPGVPFSLADDSAGDYSGGGQFAGDTEGVFGINSDFDNDFFGISDSDEFGGGQTASWTFDVAGFTDLALSIDFGGISNSDFGGYPTSTDVKFFVSFDGGADATAFDLDPVDNPGFVTRPMDNGAASGGGRLLEVGGDNPVTKFLAEDGSMAGDLFLDKSDSATGAIDTFMTSLTGAGSTLTITLVADVPFEALAFDNISITGIPTPGAAALLGLAGLAAARRRRA